MLPPITVPHWFTHRVLRKHLRCSVPMISGQLLDVGCGKKPYQEMFDVAGYTGIDINALVMPDVMASAKNIPFRSASFDAVLCNQLLEHVDDVDAVLEEISRVSAEGGWLILSVPFIARLHGGPHDYWRFSQHGVAYLLSTLGLRLQRITPVGGFFTTQCYLWLFFLWEKTRAAGRSKLIRTSSALLFALLNPLCWLVHHIDNDVTTPFNYIVIARKEACKT